MSDFDLIRDHLRNLRDSFEQQNPADHFAMSWRQGMGWTVRNLLVFMDQVEAEREKAREAS